MPFTKQFEHAAFGRLFSEDMWEAILQVRTPPMRGAGRLQPQRFGSKLPFIVQLIHTS